MQDLNQEEAAWVLKEVRSIKREQRLQELTRPLVSSPPSQLNLPIQEPTPQGKLVKIHDKRRS